MSEDLNLKDTTFNFEVKGMLFRKLVKKLSIQKTKNP